MNCIDDNCYFLSQVTYYGRVKETFRGYGLFQNVYSILDWGCCTGETTREIAHNSLARVHGIDWRVKDEEINSLLKEFGGRVNLVRGDGFSYFQERGQKFDLVLCNNNILFILNSKNINPILESMIDLVNPDGKLIFSATEGIFSEYAVLRNEDGSFVGDSIKKNKFYRFLKNMDVLRMLPEYDETEKSIGLLDSLYF